MSNNKKQERYIKLKSVGSYLDTKSGFVFPEYNTDSIYKWDSNGAVHLSDCCLDWHLNLSDQDHKLISKYFIFIKPNKNGSGCSVKAVK